MVTTVGNESTIQDLVQALLYLEHDAIAAYDSTIEKLENPSYKSQVAKFRDDHLRHVLELGKMASMLRIEAPAEGDSKQLLTTGKVALASLMGDGAILTAMRSNEEDTVTAYERASTHCGAAPEFSAFFAEFAADERRHREWMQQTAAAA
jgi:rubrerythrin